MKYKNKELATKALSDDLLSRCCIGVLTGSVAGIVFAWAFLG